MTIQTDCSSDTFGAASRLPAGYHLRHVDANADHHGYFDPAEGPVTNPGMGISGYVVSDHMHVSRTSWEDWRRTATEPHLALDRATFDQMLELPHVDNLYFRTEWRDVQRERGKLQIPEAWKWMLEAVEAKDKSWGFRIMNCCPHSTHPNGLPDFLQDRFEMKPYWTKDFSGGPKYFPYYTDEYLDYWKELLQLLAAEFDHHPRLEYVDVSGYGFWGELHHWGNYDGPDSPLQNYEAENADEIISRLIRDHLDAFKLTPAALGLHGAECRTGREAFEQGLCWGRRDSFMTNFSPAEAMLARGLAPGHGMVWETIVPGLRVPVDGVEIDPGQCALPQRWFDIQAHYGAVGFNPWDMIWAHEQCQSLLENLAQNLAYRLRPSVIWSHRVGKAGREIVLGLRNDGSSQVPGVLTVKAEFSNGHSTSVELAPGDPVPGKMTCVPIPCDDEALSGFDGTVRFSLSLRMKGKDHPVQWAIATKNPGERQAIKVPVSMSGEIRKAR